MQVILGGPMIPVHRHDAIRLSKSTTNDVKSPRSTLGVIKYSLLAIKPEKILKYVENMLKLPLAGDLWTLL